MPVFGEWSARRPLAYGSISRSSSEPSIRRPGTPFVRVRRFPPTARAARRARPSRARPLAAARRPRCGHLAAQLVLDAVLVAERHAGSQSAAAAPRSSAPSASRGHRGGVVDAGVRGYDAAVVARLVRELGQWRSPSPAPPRSLAGMVDCGELPFPGQLLLQGSGKGKG